MAGRASEESRRLVAATLTPDDRVLLTGAGGWFGRTALDLLSGSRARVLAVAARSRTIEVRNRSMQLVEWSDSAVQSFAPTIVIDCAFLTREKIALMPLDEYVRRNRLLTERLLAAASASPVRIAVTVSSGAAVHPTDARSGPLEANPYGYLKAEAEAELLALAGGDRRAIVARAWSVSGGYNQRPHDYAMSDMILQAASGSISIQADHEVWRRYSSVDELLAVAVANGRSTSGIIESGGPLVEMAGLAEAVRSVVNPAATITRPPLSGSPDHYHSDGTSWDRACADVGIRQLDLFEQIELTAKGVLDPGALPDH